MTAHPERFRSLPLDEALSHMVAFMTDSPWTARRGQPGVMDLALGNPQEIPIAGFAETLRRWSEPENPAWFAYTMSLPGAQEVAARALRGRTGLPFQAEDIAMTTGAFSALSTAFRAVTMPGDEVIINLPPWTCYELLIREAGATPVKVQVDAATFDLDVEAIAAAITPRTRLVVVNTPHNPTGRIYSSATLQRLASLLNETSRTLGRRIYLLSDEAYARVVFDGKRAISPAETYCHTLISYTWGKQLLTPGQRIGYLALAPDIPDPERQELRRNIRLFQIANGYQFPNALLQHALGDLDRLSIDIGHYQRKRDRMVAALREIGYEVQPPEGTFYLLLKAPLPDERRFVDLLAARDVFVLPGSNFEMPGYFRISLTATDDMLDRSLAHFAAVMEECRTAVAVG